MKLEDVIFVDVLGLGRDGDGVAQEREAGQRVLILQERQILLKKSQRDSLLRVCTSYLVRLVEKEAEVGEDHPEFLPAVAVLKLPQQVA